MRNPILIVTTSDRYAEVAPLLERGMGVTTLHAAGANDACVELKRALSLAIVDTALPGSDSTASDLILAAAGPVPVLETGLLNPERMVRQVRTILRRRDREHSYGIELARKMVRSELRGVATGLLLHSELALQEPGPVRREAVQELRELALAICEQLRLPPPLESSGSSAQETAPK